MLRHLRISVRLCLGFAFVLALFLVNSLATNRLLSSIQESVTKFDGESLPFALRAERMAFDVSQVQQFLTDVSATRDRGAFKEAAEAAEAFEKDVAEFRDMFRREKDAAALEQLESLDRLFKDFNKKGVAMAEAYLSEGLEAGKEHMEIFDAQAETLTKSLEGFRDAQVAEATGLSGSILAAVDRASLLALLLGALAVSGGLGAALVLTRSIASPLGVLTVFARQVAGGDFKAALPAGIVATSGRSEIGLLSRDVSAMVGELKKRLGFAQGVLDGMPSPCLVVDQAERIIFVNRHMLAFLDQEGRPEDFLGMNAAEFFYGDSSHKTVTSLCMRDDCAMGDIPLEITTRKGVFRSAQLSASPLHDLDGDMLGVFVILADLTDMRAKERMITSQNQRISEAASTAESVSGAISRTAEELSDQVERASRGASEQKDRLTETAAAMQQMNATGMEIARNASSAAESADLARRQAVDGADKIGAMTAMIMEARARAEDLKEQMAGLDGVAGEIGKVLGVIEDIADQTNLLALNAAIEAARAGDAGRGFAVVADEVRKLAEKTMTATKEVGEAVTGIQGRASRSLKATDDAVAAVVKSADAAKDSGARLEAIVALSVDATDKIRSIAAAAEEQSAASEQINRAVEIVTGVSDGTAHGMARSGRAMEDLAEQVERLRSVIEGMIHDESAGASNERFAA